MFKLQRLEITGFKSFADYTELVFTGNGITAIVGPNGCGKSNVADAISWVLGEQRAKSLRGGEMKDVIFQGSKNRLPSGMAEVVLHMVRDETVEEEPDIDDIDATLEELDDQAGAVEERLAPELTAGEAAAQPDAQATPDASASVVPTPEVAHATAHEGVALTEEDEAAGANAVTHEVNADAPAVAVVEAEVVESPSLEADAQKTRGSKARAQHKRHWRPRRLALDFAPGEVVSVTRRLYRDGESEYLLNGRVCRLRDIQDLFSGTGLSGAHYAIIEQGRIGQILSAKPMDRRTLIEEAAGITKFRVRQRAAEARLEAARTNLSRVSDIISEIERQVGSLRRQAAKARRYHQLREELRELLRKVYAADEHTLTARLEELRESLATANEEVERFASELEEREEDARRATAEARGREEELAAERAAVSESALILDRRERERTYQGEQIAALERRLEEVRREAEAVSARIASVIAESESLTLRDVQMREETEATARQLRDAEEAYARRAAEVVEAESAIESARGELLTHTAAAERLSEIGRQLETVLEKLAAQADGLAREGERAAAAHEQAEAEAAKLQEEIGVARTHLNALHSERESRARELSESRAEVAAAAAEHARVRDESARVRHRLDTLAEIDTQHSLYSRAVQRIFSPAETDAPKDFHVVATLADFLRVEPRWERAVEGVFGPHLQSVIVPTPDDALRAAAWLQATGAGRATFLVAGLRGGAELEDSDDAFATVEDESVAVGDGFDATADADVSADVRVASLLGAPRELAAVLGRTLAREMNARVAPSLERAIELALDGGEMCVTAGGECVIAGQLIAAGGAPVAEDGVGLLAFKREMRELEVRMVGLEADLVFADESAKSARARLAELEDAFVLLNDEIGRVEREQVAREVSARQLQHEIERAERHMRVVADDAARLAEERREVEERRAKQLADALAAEESRASAQRAVSEAADALAEARRAAEAESGKVGEQRAQAAAAAERRRAAAAELRRMESESAELHARLERHEREASEGRERIEALRRSLNELDESASGAESERASLERRVEEAAARLAEARERADALTQEVAELHHQASSARDARAALEVQRAESAARLNYVRESCMSELNQPLEEVAASFTPEEGFDLEASRARLEEIRARVEGFGAVNMMALEELAENEERLTFLTAQRQDITDGIHSTEEALREIKKRSRERFRHAFEEINRNFGRFFLELFGGGRGEMSLIDTEDVLESGIDIVAQPPGKRLQNVLLLSGGEKAMAALSLVLAIFRYRPSPFCLLDEVDAPLDEANVGRFTTKVNEMSAETQFLVITHNKRTMETARALYGVTMEEAGVSRLVSVRFD